MLSSRAAWAVAAVLSAAHWLIAVLASRQNATTFDEVAHISGGMAKISKVPLTVTSFSKFARRHLLFSISSQAMVVHGDYRLNPENGALPQKIAGAAIVAGGGRFPEVADLGTLEGQSWRHSDSWELGYQALYLVGNDAARVLLLGRGAVALSGLGTVLLVHGMARYVYKGDAASSLLATLLAAACPTMLAHGALITSDGVFTFTASLASASIWFMLDVAAAAAETAALPLAGEVHTARRRAPGWPACLWWALATGVAVGLVIVAKHSGVIIAPIAVLLLLIRTWSVGRQMMPGYALRVGVAVIVSVATMMGTIWGMYGFRYSAFRHLECHQWRSNWDSGLGSQHGKLKGAPAFMVEFAKTHRVLPEAMLFGMSYAFLSTHARACFLAGWHGTTGWRSFFPYAVAVKTPSGVLALLAVALVAHLFLPAPHQASSSSSSGAPCSPNSLSSKGSRANSKSLLKRRDSALFRATPLIVLMLIYGAVAVNQNLNIGHRHMLPVYPGLYVLCGASARFLLFLYPSWGRGAKHTQARIFSSQGAAGGGGGGGGGRPPPGFWLVAGLPCSWGWQWG
jgi:hypothetical protein